jgi:pimeloyl-ACP methyl ester carboxylesterase
MLKFYYGGPGVAGVPKVKELGAALDRLGRGRFDVVSWDPRGTGDSDHVVCFDDEQSQERFWGDDWSIPTTRAESRRYLPKTVAFARRPLIVLCQSLGNPMQWPGLATALDEAARGDGSTLENIAREAKPFLQSALVSAVALQCADKPPPRQGPRAWPVVIDWLTGISFISGPVNGWFLWAPCSSWPVPSAQRYIGPWNAYTETPILVIGTRFDPNTAFGNARRAAHRLGNAVLLIHDGYGHTSDQDRSACVERATSAYLVDLVTQSHRTVCPSDRLPFDPNFGEPLP